MKRLLYVFVLVTGLLAACNQQGEHPQLSAQALALGDIEWLALTQGTAKDLAPFNCAVNGLNLPGQGYRANTKPQDGGLTYDVNETVDTGVTTASRVGFGWRSTSGLLAVPQRNVTLLVVDDFRSNGIPSNGVYTPQPELFTQTTLNGTTLASLQDAGDLSHGSLVYQHAQDVVRGTLRYPFSSTPSPTKTLFRTTFFPTSATRYFTVEAVDTGFESTGLIADSIKSTVIAQKLLGRLDAPGGPFIVNLSFGLLPCEAYADFIAWDEKTPSQDEPFEDYLKALQLKNSDFSYEVLVTTIVDGVIDPSNPDPLFTLMAGPLGVMNNIFVAASGNYGFAKTSLWPAKFPGVVNVGGSAAIDPSKRNERFNTGKVMDVAASFLLRASRFTNNPNAKDVYYLGTSFSTPSVSVYSALDVASQQRCLNLPNVFPKSKLGNSNANINVVDSALKTAVGTLCPVP